MQQDSTLSKAAGLASPVADGPTGTAAIDTGFASPGSQVRGEEFRDDLRAPGARNAQARKALSAQELQPFTHLDDVRSLLAMAQTGVLLVVAGALIVGLWGSPSPFMFSDVCFAAVVVGVSAWSGAFSPCLVWMCAVVGG